MKLKINKKLVFASIFCLLIVTVPLVSSLNPSMEAWKVYADSQGYKEMEIVAEGFGVAFGVAGALAIACGVQVAIGLIGAF